MDRFPVFIHGTGEQAHPDLRDDGENSETDSALDFAKDCGSIAAEQHQKLVNECSEVGKMLGSMLNNPESFLIHKKT